MSNTGMSSINNDIARQAAWDEYNLDGRIEVDRHDAVVSWSGDSQGLVGAYVQAWVFVHVADMDLEDEDDLAADAALDPQMSDDGQTAREEA